MLNAKLKMLRLLNEEINRLEKIRVQMHKRQGDKDIKKYDDDLVWCKTMRDWLIGKRSVGINELLEEAYLSKKEKAMAHAYYCEGKTWEQAFGAALEMFTAKELEEYEKAEKEEEAKEAAAAKANGKGKEKEKVKSNKYVEKLKKSIARKIQM